MSVGLTQTPKFTALDSNGNPWAGAKLYTYETGTTTPKTSWTDATRATPNLNPIILDSYGQADVWIDSVGGNYRLKLVDPEGNTIWTVDEVEGKLGVVTAGLDPGDVLQVDQAEASTATATTTILGTATTKHLLTGNVTITGFTGTAGVTYHCRADEIFTLTHHATNLIITQGAANITTAAGDTFDVQMITGTTARIVNYARATGHPITPPTANRNQIINGGFFVNQRGYVSGTNTTSANEYTLDRWRVVTSEQSVTWTDLGGKRTVTVPAGGVEQVIEGAFLPAGTYTISWEGTATCAVDGTARTNGESFSVAGGSNVTVKFSDGTVANAQLEAGSVATPFEQRPIGVESNLCHRYYVHTIPIGGSGYATDSGQTGRATASTSFPTEMRVVPTISYTNDGGNMSGSLDGSTAITLRGCVANQTATDSGSVYWSGKITCDAEL
jgi:hypothetical protein